MVKVGDKVLFTGESGNDMTHGQTYEVCYVENGLFAVCDDAGDEHFLYEKEFEPATATANDTDDTTFNFAEKASTYGIKITVIVGDCQIIYDGSEVAG